ncbi:haloacid dehalogenase-like hydrolase domain-containing protein 2 isoform X2 [Physella acuta]|nr:haloacid dehalogenase-like hydrolase domain-containing protein 2 isoform X2 [Physella acuta]XP_059159276.1 haloacid dehalogenase-like hydrolase domain-containing protein 2 isoform X2 [Physella acuta]XP_059159277.1 haloacid dehalogenase-like hydrolase domain-containing protein 2 isoform X2 [Physella acuta]XP_059159279.1 haloacid dehalogenase-like hydrolase domain-containing protein 2 isoform X2 [Physella acuta]XP_059159280.1 haloacid dehalogenase-like hydrolase domain-containing protein 2 iso
MASQKIKTILIDLSGTLHIDDDQTPGAVDALKRLQANKNLHIKFVTNTTKESKNFLLNRLNKIGFSVTGDQVYTSLSAARKLIDDKKLRPFFMIDKNALEDFEGVPTHDPNAVLIGLAPEEFNYENMNKAMRLLQNGASLIAIHKARYYKRNDGLALGPGPFVAALEYATDVTAEVVGKPEANFFLSSIAELDCEPAQCVMVGDDVRDDIQGAQTVGMVGILVKTGKYRAGDESKINPAPYRVADNFSQAVDYIEELLQS